MFLWYLYLVNSVSAGFFFLLLSTVRPSTLPMRLLSLDKSYIGRLQVMYNGAWGNVCDDLFSQEDADVACWSLNFTNGAICYANRPFPSTSGIFHCRDNVSSKRIIFNIETKVQKTNYTYY